MLGQKVLIKTWPEAFSSLRLRWQLGLALIYILFIVSVVAVLLAEPVKRKLIESLGLSREQLEFTCAAFFLLVYLSTPHNMPTVLLGRLESFYLNIKKKPKWFPVAVQGLAVSKLLFFRLQADMRAQNLLTIYLLPTALCLGGVWFYATTLYPRLPQALGGAQPQCVTLDLEADSIAKETLALLGATGHPAARTAKVWLLFSSSDSLVVQPRSGASTSGVVELRRDAVSAVAICR